MPTFKQAGEDVEKLVAVVMDQHHERLKGLDLMIDCLFAFATRDKDTGEPKGHALKHQGDRALAIIRITSPKERIAGRGDAELTIDHDWWAENGEDAWTALVDHELTHLLPVVGKDGELKFDECGRPRLKMRPHDFHLAGFEEIIQRHGEAACETVIYKPIHKVFTQLLLPYG